MRRNLVAFWAFLAAALASPPALADISYPARPGQRDFISDGAKLLSADDAAAIKATADKLLTDKDIAIVVATIDSMSSFGAGGWPIERYAMNLFDEWGIGRADHNYGILLLVSKGDRKARIELGKAFNRERDEECSRIMSTAIIPRFKQGDFSGGIKAGVIALDNMARGVTAVPPRRAAPAVPSSIAPSASPPRSSPPVQYAPAPRQGLSPTFIGPLVCVGIGFLAIVVLIVVAVARNASGGGGGIGSGYGGGFGGGGWGWGGGGWGSSMPPWWWWVPGPGSHGGGMFGSSSSTPTHTHSSGDSFGGFGGGGFSGGGGGSFGGGGGGFSGGGGSTGSW